MKKTYLKPQMEFHQIGMTHYLIGMSDQTKASSGNTVLGQQRFAEEFEGAEAEATEDLW